MQLFEGDCLDILPSIPDGSVDMVMCDLPYGVTARNKWDSIIPYKPLWEAYARVCKPNAAMVFTAIQPFAAALIMSNINLFKEDHWFHYEWIWEKSKKTNFLNASKEPLRNHEQVLVFYRSQPTYNPQGVIPCHIECDRGSEEGTGTNYGKANPKYVQEWTNYPTSIQRFKSQGKVVHPTQKPVPLMEYLILTYTNLGDVVLDNTMGSGTTGIACVATGRDFIGIEKDPEFFAIAKQRIEDAQGPVTSSPLFPLDAVI